MNEETPNFSIPDPNTFRWYCTEMFYANKEERMSWRQHPITEKEYFRANKWYLKKLFKEIQNGNT